MTSRWTDAHGPMSNLTGIVTYIDLAEWAGITISEAEQRFGGADGPERMRIAGEDCFWVAGVLQFINTTTPTHGPSVPPGHWDGSREMVTNVNGTR